MAPSNPNPMQAKQSKKKKVKIAAVPSGEVHACNRRAGSLSAEAADASAMEFNNKTNYEVAFIFTIY